MRTLPIVQRHGCTPEPGRGTVREHRGKRSTLGRPEELDESCRVDRLKVQACLAGGGLLVEIGAACAKAGEYSEGAWLRIAERMRKLAGIVNQCADNVQTTDQEFKNRLEVMDFFATGSVG